MSAWLSFVKKLTKVLSFPPKPQGYCTVSTNAPLPSPVLDTINSIRSGKGSGHIGAPFAGAKPYLLACLANTR